MSIRVVHLWLPVNIPLPLKPAPVRDWSQLQGAISSSQNAFRIIWLLHVNSKLTQYFPLFLPYLSFLMSFIPFSQIWQHPLQQTECISRFQSLSCWILIPQVMMSGGGDFGRWSGHEGGAPMNGISALIKETPESSFVPSSMWGHSLWTRKKALTRHLSDLDDLGLPSNQNCEMVMLIVSHPVYGIFVTTAQLTKMLPPHYFGILLPTWLLS